MTASTSTSRTNANAAKDNATTATTPATSNTPPAATTATPDDSKVLTVEQATEQATKAAFDYAIQANTNGTAAGHHMARVTGALIKAYAKRDGGKATWNDQGKKVTALPAVQVLAAYTATLHGVPGATMPQDAVATVINDAVKANLIPAAMLTVFKAMASASK
jgi:hypothetical protein